MNAYNVIILLGPTAAGKSALGVTMAKRFGGVIISADSRQVYRGLDLGTGKISRREMRGVPHFLLDVASPQGQYSVARYVRDVARVLRPVDPSVPIFVVGGSPFYIKAITEANSFSSVPPNPLLRRRLAARSTNQLLNRLRRLNPARAKTIDPANRRRIIRAIEVSNTPPAGGGVARSGGGVGDLPPMRTLKIGLTAPRAQLYKRIDRRLDQRMRRGLVGEVRRLHQQGLSWTKLEAFGLEYRFISRYLRGRLTKTEVFQQLTSAIHDFSRRQMSWWKKDKDIAWVSRPDQAQALISQFLSPLQAGGAGGEAKT